MEGSGNSDASRDQGSLLVTPYYTPYQKQILQKSDLEPVNMEDLSPGSGGDSSVASLKEGSRSPSSSSWDSEPEYVIASDGEGPSECIELREDFPDMEQENQSVGVEKEDNNMLWEGENKSYDDLLKKFIENEEELRVSKFKLQLSEEEIVKLKIQIEKSEGQLDYVRKELKLKDDDLEHEKGQVLELQKQTAEFETHVPDCCYKIAKLVEQLEVANEQLKISNDENTRLRNELGSRSSETHQLQGQLEVAQENVAKLECQFESGRKQIQELEDRITWHKANENNVELEMRKLKAEMLNVRAQFSLEKDQLQSDIASLSEVKIQLTSRLEEWESISNALENKIRQSEAENLKQEELHATQQMVLQGEITFLKEELGQKRHELEAVNKELELQVTQQMVSQGEIISLKAELDQRRHDVEAVNKEFDRHKQKYDMLVTERDEAIAKIDKLKAEISFRGDQIANIERELFQLHAQQVNDLKLKVEELEKEVIRQNAVISDLAEEKREAIRQLCFSLEHYRSGYQELLRAFAGHRRRAAHAVIAS